jgi:uncharacterized protein YeaO (DUF488 family)
VPQAIANMIRTKRWNDPVEAEDGLRLLVCRFRPRGLPKAKEPWHAWCKDLAPSVELHASWYGKRGLPPTFVEFARRYCAEMRRQAERIRELAEHVATGETLTLLCSSACSDAQRCHRTLLKELIEKDLGSLRRRRRTAAD